MRKAGSACLAKPLWLNATSKCPEARATPLPPPIRAPATKATEANIVVVPGNNAEIAAESLVAIEAHAATDGVIGANRVATVVVIEVATAAKKHHTPDNGK